MLKQLVRRNSIYFETLSLPARITSTIEKIFFFSQVIDTYRYQGSDFVADPNLNIFPGESQLLLTQHKCKTLKFVCAVVINKESEIPNVALVSNRISCPHPNRILRRSTFLPLKVV
jgi:hypothetical protein